jgi:hypothetical protein
MNQSWLIQRERETTGEKTKTRLFLEKFAQTILAKKTRHHDRAIAGQRSKTLTLLRRGFEFQRIECGSNADEED